MSTTSGKDHDLLLQFLENIHSTLRTVSFGMIDMDKIQGQIKNSVPSYTTKNGVICAFSAAIFWVFVFYTVKYTVTNFMENNRRKYEWAEEFFKMNSMDMTWYMSYIHAIVHAYISTVGAFYCFFYADGKPGTTWFHDDSYRYTMWDI